MLISTSSFIFLAVVIIIYFLVKKEHQWKVLLAANCVFYYLSSKWLIVLLFSSTLIAYLAGILLDNENKAIKDLGADKELKKVLLPRINKKKTWIMTSALLLNFGVLFLFKYYDLFREIINPILNLFSSGYQLPTLILLLPLGISFYTFQSAGYIIDVHRGKISADRNFAKFALFVSFFPQLIQGPISRYNDLASQFFESHEFNFDRLKSGALLILWGLFKKLVIADRIAIPVNTIIDNFSELDGPRILFGFIQYSIQIYCDFSGGIDIARGIAEILGITLPINFKQPLFSTSVEGFWRRWHITLGNWMRDYIFYPLSLSKPFVKLGKFSRKIVGNRLGKQLPTILAMLITFTIIGLWHGQNWKFIIFGLYHGVIIVSEILLTPAFSTFLPKIGINRDCFSWRLFNIYKTFLIISIGRIFSRADNLTHAFAIFRQSFSVFYPWSFFEKNNFDSGLDQKNQIVLVIAIIVLIIVEFLKEKGISVRKKISEQNLPFRWLIYLTLIFSILILGIYGIVYNESDFIYRGF